MAEQTSTHNRETVVTRTFEAPRTLVWRAWTDPDPLSQWWGPKDFTNPVCHIDVRPGGTIRIDMLAPDGTVYPMTGVFHEIVEHERLVFSSFALDKAGKAMFEVLNTVTFTESAGRTTLTLQAQVTMQTETAAPYLHGMEQGWGQSLDRLAAQVSRP